jgi:hypothetical protein
MQTELLTEFGRLSRDIKAATTTLERKEARYLVDLYYNIQHYRISSRNQERAMESDEEPHLTISFFADQMQVFENQIKRVLDAWTDNDPLGQWAKSITGIGPVIAAGLLAHIDIHKANTAGKVWRYAGLDPTSEWNKGEKRPWNASLKVICWKAGESFVKVSNNEKDFYGKIYAKRKEYEIERNDQVREVAIPRGVIVDITQPGVISDGPGQELYTIYPIADKYYTGGNAQWAYKALKKKIGKDTDAYASYSIGKLPPAHIHARAKRYAVKLFLAHYQEVGYKITFGEAPPAPYPMAILGHSDYIPPPNQELI